jgi:DNA-binding transcriptional regulator YhcF (GntR family)
MATVYDGDAVVNPVPANPGGTVAGLYDWLRSVGRAGRMRRVEVTPPVSRYEQVARQLREQIFGGDYPPGSRIPSGWTSGRYPVSQPVVQRACAVLEAEGLVRMEPGRGTTVLERRRWRVEIEAPLPGSFGRGEAAAEAARVKSAIDGARQPAISGVLAQWVGARLVIMLTVESADLAGAVAAGLPVAKAALAPLEIERQAAGPA